MVLLEKFVCLSRVLDSDSVALGNSAPMTDLLNDESIRPPLPPKTLPVQPGHMYANLVPEVPKVLEDISECPPSPSSLTAKSPVVTPPSTITHFLESENTASAPLPRSPSPPLLSRVGAINLTDTQKVMPNCQPDSPVIHTNKTKRKNKTKKKHRSNESTSSSATNSRRSSDKNSSRSLSNEQEGDESAKTIQNSKPSNGHEEKDTEQIKVDTSTTILRKRDDTSKFSDEEIMREMKRICNSNDPHVRFQRSKEVGSG